MWEKEICPYYLVWVRGAFPRVSLTLFTASLTHTFFMNMSMNINNFGGTINYNDHHKEFTISGASTNVSEIVRSFFSEDITPVQEVEPEQKSDPFPYFTQKCFDENRVTSVEAEIQAARKGTAETMWRTLWNNENLGYLEVEPIDATTLYRAIEKHYGKLPYTERNFRGARSKR